MDFPGLLINMRIPGTLAQHSREMIPFSFPKILVRLAENQFMSATRSDYAYFNFTPSYSYVASFRGIFPKSGSHTTLKYGFASGEMTL